MEKKYKVTYLPLFYEDLDQIIGYIINELNNPIAANNLLNEIEKSIEERIYNPTLYKEYKKNIKSYSYES